MIVSCCVRSYVAGSDRAFGVLVGRHLPAVFSGAMRRVNGERALAEDVTQQVFADLARKARSLPPDVVLAGWLHRHTGFIALKSSIANADAARGNRRPPP